MRADAKKKRLYGTTDKPETVGHFGLVCFLTHVHVVFGDHVIVLLRTHRRLYYLGMLLLGPLVRVFLSHPELLSFMLMERI